MTDTNSLCDGLDEIIDIGKPVDQRIGVERQPQRHFLLQE